MAKQKLTHAVCRACWDDRYKHEPVAWVNPPEEICCSCLKATTSGIYVRGQPRKFQCGGETGFHQ